MIKSEDIIFDEETGQNRKIRYVAGEASIYADKQSENAKMREPISFTNGFLL